MEIIKPVFKWNGTLTKRTKTEAVIIHHAEAAMASVEQIHSWHQNPPNNWAGIGYNFYIRKDGKIYEGRGWDKVGAHAGTTSGYNSRSIGICFEGAYNSTDTTMPSAQYNAGVWLIREAMRRYGSLRILKHGDVTATSCPGKYFPFDKMKAEVINGEEDDDMTQEQFNQMYAIAKAAEAVEKSRMPVSKWAEEAWNKAVAAGVFDGTSPQGTISREQTAVVLNRIGLIK